MGVFGSSLAPFDPNSGAALIWRDLPNGNTVFDVPPTLPDAAHFLGTDPLGRDQWSRILAGAWLTLAVVVGGTITRLAIGVTIGVIAGWFGGATSRVIDVVARGVAALPQLLLAILLVLVTRPWGLAGFVLSLAVVGWPEIAEFLQAETRRVKLRAFVEAARAIGASDQRIVLDHVLKSLVPQLLTVGALETGGVLLLLAELGLVGLFISGATFLIGDFGPIGPLKGRVPEWGQMLGAIQFYAITEQLSTLLPAVFMVVAAGAFAFLADGLRAASDPFSPRALRPATFGFLTKLLTAALCFSAVGFVGANVRTGVLTMDEGRALAAETAGVMWPGSVFVAGVARYISPTHGFAKPDRLTYYYRRQNDEVLRISFLNGDRYAKEVRQYETEDELDFASLKPLPTGLVSYSDFAATANAEGGGQLRADLAAPIFRAIVTWPTDRVRPAYVITIGTQRELTLRRFCCFDAVTGDRDIGAAWAAF